MNTTKAKNAKRTAAFHNGTVLAQDWSREWWSPTVHRIVATTEKRRPAVRPSTQVASAMGTA